MKAINCHPDADLVFRKKSKRRGELLLICPVCNAKYQCRKGGYSHPYQVKKKSDTETKTINVRGRITETRKKQILEKYKSIQFFLDNG